MQVQIISEAMTDICTYFFNEIKQQVWRNSDLDVELILPPINSQPFTQYVIDVADWDMCIQAPV